MANVTTDIEVERTGSGADEGSSATKSLYTTSGQSTRNMPQLDHSAGDGVVNSSGYQNDLRLDHRSASSGSGIVHDDVTSLSKVGSTENNGTMTNSGSGLQFQAREIETLVGEVLSERLGDVRYEPARCKQMSQELAAHIMDRIKAMAIRKYKMVAIVSIGSQKGVPGMQFGSRCLWNKDTDHFASVKFTNGSLFAVAMVYGMYFE